jgi:translation initiation factor IF-1
MSRLTYAGCLLAGMASAGLAWGVWTQLYAQESTQTDVQPEAKDAETMEGRIEKLLKNKHDDVDGLKLATGDEVRFPPHVGKEVARRLKPGDAVTVLGRKATRPRGEVVFEAAQIKFGEETIVVERPKPRDPRPDDEQPVKTTGKVKEFARNAHDDVDGLVLSDDVEVKFPPHLGEKLEALVKIGDEVQIEGRRHETPHGEIHLHADRITATASGKSLERDKPKKHPAPHDGARDRPERVTNEEILRELKAIRRLLENRE